MEILSKHNDSFQYKVEWGTDLQTEHERFLTEQIYKKPDVYKRQVGELRHKIEQLLKGAGRDGHGRMLMGEHDAVLVVIYIGAVLQIPCLLYTSRCV